MINLMTVATQATMSSRDIAELTGKNHADVLRDIRDMFDVLKIDASVFADIYQDKHGRPQPMFSLDKRLSIGLVSGYNVAMRMAIIDRWQELELELKQTAPAINFANPAIAARAWADQYEARLLAEKTKAEIGNRREATAMNTASQAVKKVNRLEIQLDQSRQYATVKRMEMLYHGQKFNWRLLKSTGHEMGVDATEVFDANYGTVKAYHADVWRETYALEIES